MNEIKKQEEQIIENFSSGKYDMLLQEALEEAYLQAYRLGANWSGWFLNLYFHIYDETIEIGEPVSHGTYSVQTTPAGYEIQPQFWFVGARECPVAWVEECGDEEAYKIVSHETGETIKTLKKLMDEKDLSLLDLFEQEFPEAYEAYYEKELKANAQLEADTDYPSAKEELLYYITDYFESKEEYVNEEEE